MNNKKTMQQLDAVLMRLPYQEVALALGYNNKSSICYWRKTGKLSKKAFRNFEPLINKEWKKYVTGNN